LELLNDEECIQLSSDNLTGEDFVRLRMKIETNVERNYRECGADIRRVSRDGFLVPIHVWLYKNQHEHHGIFTLCDQSARGSEPGFWVHDGVALELWSFIDSFANIAAPFL